MITFLSQPETIQPVYGNLVYVAQSDVSVVVRNYNSEGFKKWMLRFGWMPPHPSTFIRARLYNQFGLYATDYKTGADYELFVRLILLNNVCCTYINVKVHFLHQINEIRQCV